MAHSRNNEELQEALERIDIESWLDQEGVRYRKARGASGAQLNIKECPRCGNSDYKVYLNADTGLGNCFAGSCEEKYNKWKFIQSYLGVSAREAVEHIKQVAREMGWQPPKVKSAEVKIDTTALRLPESIPLPIGGRNLKYLDNRNITGVMSGYFNLRFCKKGAFYYTNEGRNLKQDYSNRIIIPIFDLDGELVSFQGRDITGTAEKKYLFPPGFSSTGTHLYNGHNAIGAEEIVINEGVFDVAATKMALDEEVELRNVVAIGSFGKHLSYGDDESQLAKLLRLKESGLKRVTFMWDGERQAIKDAVAAAIMVKSCGLVARVAILPNGCDPNEVPAAVVRSAYWKATTIDSMTAAKLLLYAETVR
jgi:DNA primase